MEEFIQGPFGAVHTASAVIALITGATVLGTKKGTRLHRYFGYAYFLCMLLLNITAIPITNMTGQIGMFHLFIVISLPTVVLALYYPMFSRRKKNWLSRHFEFAYWSYIGLIAAFIAEVMVRLPVLLATDRTIANREIEASGGFLVTFLVMGAVMGIAEFMFRKLKTSWLHLRSD